MHVRVGVASIIVKDKNKILLGLRKGSHGHQTWAVPGGHLELQEDPVNCAIRETREETGIEISHVKPGPWTSDVFPDENKHYLTIFMVSNYQSGEPTVLEPDKCERWAWFEWNALPHPLFKPLNQLVELGYTLKHLRESHLSRFTKCE